MCVAAGHIFHPAALASITRLFCAAHPHSAQPRSVRCIEAFTLSTVFLEVDPSTYAWLLLECPTEYISSEPPPGNEQVTIREIAVLCFCRWLGFAENEYYFPPRSPCEILPPQYPSLRARRPSSAKTCTWGPFTVLSASQVALVRNVHQENDVP